MSGGSWAYPFTRGVRQSFAIPSPTPKK
ncbi:MAG TPA: CRISPR-associated protein Cas5 [Aliiroseovarius sp.]|nr:CRISPR-associated protein Cas5 [Aliiroseovarius sp.]